MTSKPSRVLYDVNVEPFPEGIEFTPDGSQLLVRLTSANHRYAALLGGSNLRRGEGAHFDVEGPDQR